MNTDTQNFAESLLVVVVIYRMSAGQTTAIRSLAEEVKSTHSPVTVFIFDNSPTQQNVTAPDGLIIHYQSHPENSGVSAAYNAGNRMAHSLQKKWMLLMDQDSELTRGSFTQYALELHDHPEGRIFAPVVRDQKGILSPYPFRFGGGARLSSTPMGIVRLGKFMAINSGLLIHSETFERVGGYNESIPLDFSDVFFLHRFRKIDDRLFVVGTELRHHFSGASGQSKAEAADRFKTYCAGAKTFSLEGRRFMFWFYSFLRAGKLSLQYWSLQFVKIHFQTWAG